MKISAIETIRAEEFENLLWLRVHTDGGVRPRRDFFLPRTVETYIHESVAPRLSAATRCRSTGSRKT